MDKNSEQFRDMMRDQEINNQIWNQFKENLDKEAKSKGYSSYEEYQNDVMKNSIKFPGLDQYAK